MKIGARIGNTSVFIPDALKFALLHNFLSYLITVPKLMTLHIFPKTPTLYFVSNAISSLQTLALILIYYATIIQFFACTSNAV